MIRTHRTKDQTTLENLGFRVSLSDAFGAPFWPVSEGDIEAMPKATLWHGVEDDLAAISSEMSFAQDDTTMGVIVSHICHWPDFIVPFPWNCAIHQFQLLKAKIVVISHTAWFQSLSSTPKRPSQFRLSRRCTNAVSLNRMQSFWLLLIGFNLLSLSRFSGRIYQNWKVKRAKLRHKSHGASAVV
jgi:hypothetical protein